MKGKSQHHRTKNTFRFRSFADRLADINIDVIHKISKPGTELDDESKQTYFYEVSNSLVPFDVCNCPLEIHKTLYFLLRPYKNGQT
jgi:hypothetical protein